MLWIWFYIIYIQRQSPTNCRTNEYDKRALMGKYVDYIQLLSKIPHVHSAIKTLIDDDAIAMSIRGLLRLKPGKHTSIDVFREYDLVIVITNRIYILSLLRFNLLVCLFLNRFKSDIGWRAIPTHHRGGSAQCRHTRSERYVLLRRFHAWCWLLQSHRLIQWPACNLRHLQVSDNCRCTYVVYLDRAWWRLAWYLWWYWLLLLSGSRECDRQSAAQPMVHRKQVSGMCLYACV